jgi:hypothetical protein
MRCGEEKRSSVTTERERPPNENETMNEIESLDVGKICYSNLN